MHFMMLMIPKGYESAEPGAMPDAEAVAAMMEYNRALEQAGIVLAMDGLHPPAMGARVTFADGQATVIDGPDIRAAETLGGYWMIDVASRADALDWARRCPAGDNEIVEIRQVQEFEDFSDDIQDIVSKSTHSTRDGNRVNQYVDGFVLPVPKASIEAYREIARKAGEIWREYGALEFVECVADDVPDGRVTSFPLSVKLEPDEAVVFAWIVYASRAERDRINDLVMNDPRLADMNPANMPFDGKRLIWGGFETLVAL